MLTIQDKQKTLFSRQKILRDRITPSEVAIAILLDNLKIKYIFQKCFIKGNNYVIVDFYIPKPYKICIEVDGNYHKLPHQIGRDKNRDKYLQQRNFKVIHITNETALKMNVAEFRNLIFPLPRS